MPRDDRIRDAGQPALPVRDIKILHVIIGVSAAVGLEVIEDFPTVVAVVDPATTPDFPVGSLSRAECDVLVRIEAEDGSAEKVIHKLHVLIKNEW